tara:strand:+ start:638 stop:1276 length:639 start_codon:yes stop_codon:yes gene_type:complete
MEQILTEWKRFLLTESSLSRIYQHIVENECAIITAFRNDLDHISVCDESAVTGQQNNQERNRDLKAALLSSGYGVTFVDGAFIENYGDKDLSKRVEVKEDSFFVANLKNDPDFFKAIIFLGKRFCQDSVLIIPQGGQKALLYGTNHSEFPGYNNEIVVGDFHGGKEDEFMSKIRGRPFTFSEDREEHVLDLYENYSKNSRMAIRAIAKTVLR